MAGQTKTGSIEARSESEVAHLLRQEGFTLTSVRLAGQPVFKTKRLAAFLPALKRVPLMEKLLFARHLAVMIGAGLSLNRALEALSVQAKNRHFARILKEISGNIQRGQTLADSLAKYPKVFSELFINMVKVGETAGNLEEVLKSLAQQMEKDHELRSRVKGALMYPAVIILAMIGIGALIMTTVVPKLIQVFKEMGVELPPITKFVIGLSQFLSQHWLISLVGLAVFVLLARFILKSNQGRKIFDWLILKAPIFGQIVRKINSARLARTLSSLITSGVPIVSGLQISANTMTNWQFRQSLRQTAQEVQKGHPISQALKKYQGLYPPMIYQMLEVGEETGTTSDVLTQLAVFYEEEVTNLSKNLSSIIEPILILIIGAAVGLFAVSMIQPIYSIVNQI